MKFDARDWDMLVKASIFIAVMIFSSFIAMYMNGYIKLW